ncbi:porin [Cognatishimia sp. MH4019]|uniref:porin n=1 Tax=Cognatishimia sp. MH4019 TaxID=2854030 RepID=UPI001CD71EEF|nr:porin [Cognatishimia sp. MH4019]
MKKTLLLSTALVAFAGMAVADVALTGRAEMGIEGGSDENNADFFTDIDVTFTMSGETDGGLSFGASVDLDEGGDGSAASDDNTDDGGATIFISGGFGTLTMGDTDGALDWALVDAGNNGNGGSLDDDETTHAGYLGAYLDGAYDGQIARYDYSFGDFGVAISAETDDSDDDGDDDGERDTGYALGFKYDTDLGGAALSLGIGYQFAAGGYEIDLGSYDDTGDLEATLGDTDAIGVSISAAFTNGLTAGMTYNSWDVDDDDGLEADIQHVGVGVGYTTGALTLHANYGVFEIDDLGDIGDATVEGYGLSVAYDLGGGAVVHLGYGNSSYDLDDDLATSLGRDDDDESSTYSFGLGLSF